jgi:hypothetical protein
LARLDEFHGLRWRWGAWIRLSSSLWLSNDSPQAQRMMLVGRCDGNRSPASHMGIFPRRPVALLTPFLEIGLGPTHCGERRELDQDPT